MDVRHVMGMANDMIVSRGCPGPLFFSSFLLLFRVSVSPLKKSLASCWTTGNVRLFVELPVGSAVALLHGHIVSGYHDGVGTRLPHRHHDIIGPAELSL